MVSLPETPGISKNLAILNRQLFRIFLVRFRIVYTGSSGIVLVMVMGIARRVTCGLFKIRGQMWPQQKQF